MEPWSSLLRSTVENILRRTLEQLAEVYSGENILRRTLEQLAEAYGGEHPA